jgi:hypothetical protein
MHPYVHDYRHSTWSFWKLFEQTSYYNRICDNFSGKYDGKKSFFNHPSSWTRKENCNGHPTLQKEIDPHIFIIHGVLRVYYSPKPAPSSTVLLYITLAKLLPPYAPPEIST